MQYVSLVGGDEFKARGGGDFHHGQPAVRDVTVARPGEPAERVLDVDDDVPAERIDDSVDGALTSVGHGHADHSASGMTDSTPLRIAATDWDAVIDSLK